MNIGLAAWIIQDGNYGEFEMDQTYRFAVEFSPLDLRGCDEVAPPSLRSTNGAKYEAQGTIVRVAESYWVIDFGVAAFQESTPPDWAREGGSVCGTVYIGIDPFFYFEGLKDEPGMPNLFREWTIRQILLETTPWNTFTDPSGSRIMSRADLPPTFKKVPRTDAWNDDGGHGHYVLECEPAGGLTGR